MAGGLVALLDDVAALVKVTAASLDDIALGAAKASTKAMGVVIDDAAVTPQYVDGISPKRELPIIWKIAVGSIRNKLLFILPAILLLSTFLPWALTPILMIGGAYLVFEGAEKILEAMGLIGHHGAAEDGKVRDEKVIIGSATRTDFVLSAEIMVISLNEVAHEPFLTRALILVAVAFLMTVLVYGAVGLIVKMDDIGLVLAQKQRQFSQKLGRGLVKGMPIVMSVLSKVGVVAMLWVGGHLLLTGMDELGWHAPYGFVHHVEMLVHDASGAAGGVLGWLVNTAFSCLAGLIIGSLLTVVILGIKKLLGKNKPAAAH
ncbi:ABC transporter [Arthrobacter sp. YC-RL1]|uniref:DUF808 domain-containing protein n=1 Tax=Glutamicibacter soli TaxID=453836 RepID=A0A365YK34_9MICC|nr:MULTISPECIES: DUF808 domain-containing protein [Micrococcaceae]ALQ31794.1 ABC transporter [Arthrobacter sp. YC-RL1]KLI89749.1 ABC transporter [Arthrobacter sp. YC-RL1]RBM03065.1 DUF808 domain-containing protein [Glutamicibacter soli]RKS21165.1 hypothetical protein DFO58_1723 [Arthrobacter sp. AG1021]